MKRWTECKHSFFYLSDLLFKWLAVTRLLTKNSIVSLRGAEKQGQQWASSVFTIKKVPSILRRRNLKTKVSLRKRINCFPSTLRRRNSKTQQSGTGNFGCVFLRKTRAVKYHDCRNLIVFEISKLRFEINIFSVHTWTQSRCFQVPPVCRSFSVWTKGLTRETKLRF